jgi:hypothetical protein
LETKLARIKELLILKEATDAELESLIGGAPVAEPKQRVCKTCGKPGHNSKTCPGQELPLSQEKH